MSAMVAPACPAGGVIIFDYRTLHRGLPNAGTRDRPISYGVCSTGWARDTVNYPPMSCEALSAQLSADPFELQASRRAYRDAHSFWNDEGNGPSE